MAVRAGAHAQPVPGRGPVRTALGRWGRDGDPVGTLLASLEPAGWYRVDGVDTPDGLIKHVAVGPSGVFTVSTSPRGGRISVETIDERAYDGPYALARRVEGAIGCRVTPVLVYPYAKLSRPVSRQRGVIVVMTKAFGEHLLRRRPRLTEAEVQSLYHQLVGMNWTTPA